MSHLNSVFMGSNVHSDSRILFWIDWWPPDHGGGDTLFARNFIHEISQRISDYKVVTRLPFRNGDIKLLDDDDLQVVRIGREWRIEIASLLKGLRPTILYFMQIESYGYVRYICEIMSSTPFVIFHTQMLWHRYNDLFGPDSDALRYIPLERSAFDMADLIIVPSREEYSYLYQLCCTSKLVHIPNALSFNRMRTDVPALTYEDLSCSIKIAFAGRVESRMKGLEVVLTLIDLLGTSQIENICFDIIGVKSDLSEIQKRGPGNLHINIHPWMNTHSEFMSILSNSDILVMPSLYEPFGMLCLEAMALGIVPLVTSRGGLLDMVRHSVDGFHIGNPDEDGADIIANNAYQYLLRLANNRRLLASMKKRAMERARQFSMENSVEMFLSHLPIAVDIRQLEYGFNDKDLMEL